LTLYLAYKAIASFIRRKLIQSLTIVDDLPKLGVPRNELQRIRGTALICGGSISGLLAARICSDHFDNVVIVEPEDWLLSESGMNPQPAKAMESKIITNPRARIPQWYVAQGFHPTLPLVLSKLFPDDLEREIAKSGGR
ncbi:hypothetical protein M422DRAFT_130720, partial [Sphaerobolus stellatus SS14]